MPSLTGMRISRKATSGLSSDASATASAPFSASATTTSSGHACASRALSCLRSSGSSSAISAVKRPVSVAPELGDIRDLDGRLRAMRQDRVQRHLRTLTVKRLQPFAQVGQSHALAEMIGESASAVGDRNYQRSVLLFGIETHLH